MEILHKCGHTANHAHTPGFSLDALVSCLRVNLCPQCQREASNEPEPFRRFVGFGSAEATQIRDRLIQEIRERRRILQAAGELTPETSAILDRLIQISRARVIPKFWTTRRGYTLADWIQEIRTPQFFVKGF